MTLAARAEGAYSVRVWALLGLGLLLALAFLAAYGLATVRTVEVAAAALAGLGLLAVASTAWGGLPHEAWLTADRSVLAAAALLLGAALGAHRRSVGFGVLAAGTAMAVEILVRAGTSTAPESWFDGRIVQGPVGYHNAQAVLCALLLPPALWAAADARRAVRAAGGSAAVALLAVLLLTQSRASLAAAGVAVALELALARRSRLVVLAACLAGAGALLGLTLRPVDRALDAGGVGAAGDELRTYALVAAALAAAVAAVAVAPAPAVALRRRRLLAVLAGVAVLAAGSAAALAAGGELAHGVRTYTADLLTDKPPSAAPGDTRYATISLDGRRDAWRVAARGFTAAPLTGDGVGRFATRWATDRRLAQLYILQPHSIELELATELGVAGLALFALFVGALVVTLRRGLRVERAYAAAAAGTAAALLLEASVDWTWSFPGLVAPVLLLAGAAARPGGPRPRPLLTPLILVALAAFAVPYAAADRLRQGDAAAATRLDPWYADAISTQARQLEERGAFLAAAARYTEAAPLSQHPWLEWFRQARALREAGAVGPATAACVQAHSANPREDLLRSGPCGWPWLGDHYPSAHPPGRRR